jgi:hypothetical protein
LLTALLTRVTHSTSTADPERWLDLRADDFPVNPRLVSAAAKRGELDISRVGNATLVKWRELDRWLSLQRVSSRPSPPAPPSSIAHLVDEPYPEAAAILERHGYRRRKP